MSLESDASDEIAKAMEFKADPCTFCTRGVERMEDLVIAASRDEFLDLDKVKAFSRWARSVHLHLGASLFPPHKPGMLDRFLGKASQPVESGNIPHGVALAIASLAAGTYRQMIKLSKEKKVASELWDNEQKQVDELIGRLNERGAIMYGIVSGGLPGLLEAQEIIKQHNEEKTAIVDMLSAAGIDEAPSRRMAGDLLAKLAEIQERNSVGTQSQKRHG